MVVYHCGLNHDLDWHETAHLLPDVEIGREAQTGKELWSKVRRAVTVTVAHMTPRIPTVAGRHAGKLV